MKNKVLGKMQALLSIGEQHLASGGSDRAEAIFQQALHQSLECESEKVADIKLTGWILLHLIKLMRSKNLGKLEEYFFIFIDLELPKHDEQDLHDAGVHQIIQVLEEVSTERKKWQSCLPVFAQLLGCCLDSPCTRPSPLYSRILRVILRIAPDHRYLFSEVGHWHLTNLMKADLYPNPEYEESTSLSDQIHQAISAKAVKVFTEAEHTCSSANEKHLMKAKAMYAVYNESRASGNLNKASAALSLIQEAMENYFYEDQ